MKNSSDITEKIRSAIKAKLGQIGAYVDDELPDYIMVMIANKKTMKQISDDLQLFLGSKTERFTDWLDKLLTKLQAVDGDDHEDKDGQKVVKTVDSEKEKEKRKDDAKRKDAKSQPKKVSSKSDGESQRRAKKRRSDEMSKDGKVDDSKQRRSSPKPSSSQLEDAIEIPQQDSAEFEEVVKGQEKRAGKREDSSKMRMTNDRKLIPTMTGENVPLRRVRQELLHGSRTQRHEARRRRGMTSVVGSVRLQQSDSSTSEDEFYRSGVASVVRPQRRDRSPDPGRQEKLLMRACKEATTSVEESARRHAERDRYQTHRPLRCDTERSDRDPTVERGYGSDQDTRYRYRSESGFKSDYEGVHRRRYGQKSRPRHPKTLLVTCGTQTSPVAVERKKPLRAVTTLKIDQKSSSLNKEVDEKKEKMEANVEKSVYDYNPKKTDYGQKRSVSPKRLSVESSKKKDVTPEPYTPQLPGSSGLSLDLPGYSDSDGSVVEVTDDVRRVECGEVYDRYKRSLTITADGESSISSPRSLATDDDDPKFIVTLDGVAPILSRTIAVSDVDDDDDDDEKSCDNLPMTSTPMPVDTPSPIDPVLLVEEKPENEKIAKSLDELIQETQSSNKRCKFWPQCKNGPDCSFVHPSAPCHMFPNCSFGSKCLYIHPNCRYDANCVNADCPYMHASRRDPLALAAAKVIKSMPKPSVPLFGQGLVDFSKPCRFYPNCFNTKCPFVHRAACRYGTACRNRACTYSHPAAAGKDMERFKWCSTEKFVISSVSSSGADK